MFLYHITAQFRCNIYIFDEHLNVAQKEDSLPTIIQKKGLFIFIEIKIYPVLSAVTFILYVNQ